MWWRFGEGMSNRIRHFISVLKFKCRCCKLPSHHSYTYTVFVLWCDEYYCFSDSLFLETTTIWSNHNTISILCLRYDWRLQNNHAESCDVREYHIIKWKLYQIKRDGLGIKCVVICSFYIMKCERTSTWSDSQPGWRNEVSCSGFVKPQWDNACVELVKLSLKCMSG